MQLTPDGQEMGKSISKPPEQAALSSSALLACFAVIYRNYSPLEVDSLWAHKEDAEARAFYLGDSWQVCELEIHQHANVQDQPRRQTTKGE